VPSPRYPRRRWGCPRWLRLPRPWLMSPRRRCPKRRQSPHPVASRRPLSHRVPVPPCHSRSPNRPLRNPPYSSGRFGILRRRPGLFSGAGRSVPATRCRVDSPGRYALAGASHPIAATRRSNASSSSAPDEAPRQLRRTWRRRFGAPPPEDEGRVQRTGGYTSVAGHRLVGEPLLWARSAHDRARGASA